MKLEIEVRGTFRRFVEVPDDSEVAKAVRAINKDAKTDEDIDAADRACEVICEWRSRSSRTRR